MSSIDWLIDLPTVYPDHHDQCQRQSKRESLAPELWHGTPTRRGKHPRDDQKICAQTARMHSEKFWSAEKFSKIDLKKIFFIKMIFLCKCSPPPPPPSPVRPSLSRLYDKRELGPLSLTGDCSHWKWPKKNSPLIFKNWSVRSIDNRSIDCLYLLCCLANAFIDAAAKLQGIPIKIGSIFGSQSPEWRSQQSLRIKKKFN